MRLRNTLHYHHPAPPGAGLRICLENNESIYKAGDTINGYVEWNHSTPKPYSAIELKIIGRARVEWPFGRSYVRNDQSFLSETIRLTGGRIDNEGDEGEEQTTRQIYPFSYTLPIHGLAPVFVGLFGYIFYRFEAKTRSQVSFCGLPISAAGKVGGLLCKLNFLLYEPLPLSPPPSTIRLVPERHIVEGVSSNLFCLPSGNVSISLELPGSETRGGYFYSPGTSLSVKVIVVNEGRKALKPPVLTLKQSITYFGNGVSSKREDRELALKTKARGEGAVGAKFLILPMTLEEVPWIWNTSLNIPKDLPQSCPQ